MSSVYMAAVSSSELERTFVLEALGQTGGEGRALDWICSHVKRNEKGNEKIKPVELELSESRRRTFPLRSSWCALRSESRPPIAHLWTQTFGPRASLRETPLFRGPLATKMTVFSLCLFFLFSVKRLSGASSLEASSPKGSYGDAATEGRPEPKVHSTVSGREVVSDDSKDSVPALWPSEHPCADAESVRRVEALGQALSQDPLSALWPESSSTSSREASAARSVTSASANTVVEQSMMELREAMERHSHRAGGHGDAFASAAGDHHLNDESNDGAGDGGSPEPFNGSAANAGVDDAATGHSRHDEHAAAGDHHASGNQG